VIDVFARRIVALRDLHANAFRVTPWRTSKDLKTQFLLTSTQIASQSVCRQASDGPRMRSGRQSDKEKRRISQTPGLPLAPRLSRVEGKPLPVARLCIEDA